MEQKIPGTPFATRLSGSAKETELRLRSIFQWKKKRPPAVVLAAAVLAVVLCGSLVGFRDAVPDSADPQDSLQDEPLIQQPLDSVTYVTFDSMNTSETGALRGYFPVSRVENGVQLMTGDTWYHDAWDSILLDIPEADRLNKTDFVASNGTWDLFPVEVEHKTYTWESQPEQEEWISYFQEKLLEVEAFDTPVVITEAWLFDWNGTETAVVNVGNVIVSNDDSLYVAGRGEAHAEPNVPSHDYTGIYKASALFMRGSDPVDLVTVSDGNWMEVSKGSYFPPDSGSYQQPFSAVQYDENGNLTICPVFCDHSAELITDLFQYSPALYLVCDVDGDGEAELIQGCNATSSLMRRHSVYKLVNGTLERVFSIAG